MLKNSESSSDKGCLIGWVTLVGGFFAGFIGEAVLYPHKYPALSTQNLLICLCYLGVIFVLAYFWFRDLYGFLCQLSMGVAAGVLIAVMVFPK